jgi:hypothetical protein
LQRHGSENKEFKSVSEKALGRLTTIWTFIVGIGLLLGAVWVIWRIGIEEINTEIKFQRKLAALTCFTAMFGGWVALFTSARRSEIFGVTAAYTAVLIVFIGLDPNANIGPS